MAQFTINDFVRMRDVIVTPYRGQIGRIVEIKRHPRAKDTLDKYCVHLANGETVEVWSIQLEPVREADVKATA